MRKIKCCWLKYNENSSKPWISFRFAISKECLNEKCMHMTHVKFHPWRSLNIVPEQKFHQDIAAASDENSFSFCYHWKMLRLDDLIFDKLFQQDKLNQSAGLRWFLLLWILGSSNKETLNVDLYDKTWNWKRFSKWFLLKIHCTTTKCFGWTYLQIQEPNYVNS